MEKGVVFRLDSFIYRDVCARFDFYTKKRDSKRYIIYKQEKL